MQSIALPLRERHRASTWMAIREAAAELAIDGGPAGATIDAISARAGVSRRTFFNYFQTKEDAILGTQPPVLSDEAIAAFDASSDDPLTRTARLLATTSLSSVRDDPDLLRRRELASLYPDLRLRLTQHVTTAEQLVEVLLEQRVASGELRLPGSDADQAASVRALLVIAGAAIRFVYARASSLATFTSESELAAAISLFRSVVKEAS